MQPTRVKKPRLSLVVNGLAREWRASAMPVPPEDWVGQLKRLRQGTRIEIKDRLSAACQYGQWPAFERRARKKEPMYRR